MKFIYLLIFMSFQKLFDCPFSVEVLENVHATLFQVNGDEGPGTPYQYQRTSTDEIRLWCALTHPRDYTPEWK